MELLSAGQHLPGRYGWNCFGGAQWGKWVEPGKFSRNGAVLMALGRLIKNDRNTTYQNHNN